MASLTVGVVSELSFRRDAGERRWLAF